MDDVTKCMIHHPVFWVSTATSSSVPSLSTDEHYLSDLQVNLIGGLTQVIDVVNPRIRSSRVAMALAFGTHSQDIFVSLAK